MPLTSAPMKIGIVTFGMRLATSVLEWVLMSDGSVDATDDPVAIP